MHLQITQRAQPKLNNEVVNSLIDTAKVLQVFFALRLNAKFCKVLQSSRKQRAVKSLLIHCRRCGVSIGCDEENFSFPEEFDLSFRRRTKGAKPLKFAPSSCQVLMLNALIMREKKISAEGMKNPPRGRDKSALRA